MLSLNEEKRTVFWEAFTHVIFYEFTIEEQTEEKKKLAEERIFELLHNKTAEEVIKIAEQLGTRPTEEGETIELHLPFPDPK